MTSEYKILVDRLRDGQVEKIEGFFDPTFLEIDEKELLFPSPIEVHGCAYLSEDHLILRFKGRAVAKMPCAICNQMIDVEVKISDFYHAEPLEEIREACFDYKEPLREAFLVELPKIVECKGNCPERALLSPFMRSKPRSETPTYFPFSDLN